MPYAKVIDGSVAIANTQLDGFSEVIELPKDKVFRDAFVLDGGRVVEDFDKATAIAHDRRRAKRDADMAPLDRQATYDMQGAEPLRQVVRDENAALQVAIDACEDVESLKQVVVGIQ